MRERSLAEILHYTFSGKRIEPVKRVKCLDHVPRGFRAFPEHPRNIWHTYPIKNGISASKILAENIMANNSLLKRLRERA